MDTIIVFDSRHGSTAEIASRIAGRIAEKTGGQTRLVYLRDQGSASASLDDCDLVVLGGPVYAGRWSKRAAAFAAARKEELLQRRFAFFAVGLDAAAGSGPTAEALPPELAAQAAASAKFPGTVLFDKMNFLERWIIRMVAKTREDIRPADLSAADSFADALLGG